jgi:hypothetical protein
VVDTVPVPAAPPATPSTVHTTLVSDAPVTVAVNCKLVLIVMVGEVGETETETCARAEAVAIKPTKQSAISERLTSSVARDLARSQYDDKIGMAVTSTRATLDLDAY